MICSEMYKSGRDRGPMVLHEKQQKQRQLPAAKRYRVYEAPCPCKLVCGLLQLGSRDGGKGKRPALDLWGVESCEGNGSASSE